MTNIDIVAGVYSFWNVGALIPCINTWIFNLVDLVQIKCVDVTTNPSNNDGTHMDLWAYSYGNSIEFDIQEFEDRWVGKWRIANGWESCEDRTRGKHCVAADVAAMLLHELTHKCGIAMDDATDFSDIGGRGIGSCEGHLSYIIENYFKYFLLDRLGLLGFWCCDWPNNRTNLLEDPVQISCHHHVNDGECNAPS